MAEIVTMAQDELRKRGAADAAALAAKAWADWGSRGRSVEP